MLLISPQSFFLVLGVSEISLALFKRSKASGTTKDRGSFWALWGVIALAIYLAIQFAVHAPLLPFDPTKPVTYILSVALFVGGLALRWWAIIVLGRFFTVNVAIVKDHRIVSTGPYSMLRHPSYTGALLSFCGLGIMMGNGLSFAVLVIPTLLMFLWRISVEERALEDAFGAEYAAYKARTKRLLPFIY